MREICIIENKGTVMYTAGTFQHSKKGGETCLYEGTTFMVQHSLCIYVHKIFVYAFKFF